MCKSIQTSRLLDSHSLWLATLGLRVVPRLHLMKTVSTRTQLIYSCKLQGWNSREKDTQSTIHAYSCNLVATHGSHLHLGWNLWGQTPSLQIMPIIATRLQLLALSCTWVETFNVVATRGSQLRLGSNSPKKYTQAATHANSCNLVATPSSQLHLGWNFQPSCNSWVTVTPRIETRQKNTPRLQCMPTVATCLQLMAYSCT
jgi:hypothetical protein